jgi:hypothetical protein
MSKQQYRCNVCNGQELTMRSTSNWSYAKQEFSLNEIEPDCDAYCGDCGVYVDWDWYKDGMSKPFYEYEVNVRQVIEGLQIVQATDAESAKEQAMQEFCMDIPDHSELDVTSYEMMWAGSEPTEAEKAREEADARQEEDV